MKDLLYILLIVAPWILFFIERDKRLEAEEDFLLMARRKNLDDIEEDVDESRKSYKEAFDTFYPNDVAIPGRMLDGISGPTEDYLPSGTLQSTAQKSGAEESAMAIEAIGFGEKIIIETMDDGQKVAYTTRTAKAIESEGLES